MENKSTKQKDVTWTEQNIPIQGLRISNPVMINENEFIISDYAYYSTNLKRYNTITKQWSCLLEYNQNFAVAWQYICFDRTNQRIYCCGVYAGKVHIIAFNLKTTEVTVYRDVNSRTIGQRFQSVIIESTLHLVGGYANSYHCVFNRQTAALWKKKCFDKNHVTGFIDFGLTHISSKRIILMCGGADVTDVMNPKCCNKMWKYSVSTQKWERMKCNLLVNSAAFALILTPNQKFLLLIGGRVDGTYPYYSDGIYVFDVDQEKWYQSNVKAPANTEFFGLIVQNNVYVYATFPRYKQLWSTSIKNIISDYNIALTHGFIRQNCLGLTIKQKQLFPLEIIKLIHQFY